MQPFNSKIGQLSIILCICFCTTLQGQGIDERINDAFMPVAVGWENIVFTTIPLFGFNLPIVLILLLSGALFFTVYFRFVNLVHFKTALLVVRGKLDFLERQDHDSPGGEVNHFQALTTAVSGTVGLGNIAMVAVAISLGGPGATFWMIIAGLLGMSSKFVECTLGVKYRLIGDNGKVYGGPMYYLSRGMAEKGMPNFGKILAVVFALICVGASFGGGNAFQSNQAAAQIIHRFSLGDSSGFLVGCIIAILVGVVIIGGIKRIAQVTEKVVPFMAALYILAALIILVINYQFVDDAVRLIVSEAFSPRATITGGIIGVMIQGFRRAAFSNEAGAGSAAIAHSAVTTSQPVSEGLVALLEPFIDTVLICSMTALVIIIFNMGGAFEYGEVINDQVTLIASGEQLGGVNLTSMAFDASLPGFSYVLSIAVVLFAFSTMLAWYYYGQQSWDYLFGRNIRAAMVYKVLFLLFTVLGASITLEAVIKFSDAMILALVFPNMIGLFFLFPLVKEEWDRYRGMIKESSKT